MSILVLCTDAAPPALNAADILDLICLAVLAFGFVQGAVRGLSGELSRLAALIVAFMMGLWIYEPMGAWVQSNTRLEDVRAAEALAFIIVALLAFIAMIVLRIALRRCVKLAVDQPADAVLGMFSGTLRCGVLLAAVFLVMTMVPHDDANHLFAHESRVGQVFERLLPAVREQVRKLPATQKVMEKLEYHAATRTNAPSRPPAPPSRPPAPPAPPPVPPTP